MNSKFILSKGDNKITINGKKVLDEKWLGKDDGRKLNIKYKNFDDFIEYDIYNREMMDNIKKNVYKTTHLPLLQRFKNLNKTVKRGKSVKGRTPTPHPNKSKTKAKKKKKKAKKN
jgi:hypothetical protein